MDFKIPDGVFLDPVKANERRIVDTTSCSWKNIAYILNLDTDERREVLPGNLDPGQWPQLTLGLDQGPVVRAAAKFLENELKLNQFSAWGIVHRLIRDSKLTLEHEPSGDICRGVIQSQFIMSLNRKPMGSGDCLLRSFTSPQQNVHVWRGVYRTEQASSSCIESPMTPRPHHIINWCLPVPSCHAALLHALRDLHI
jgi:hypothetical protein